MPIFRDLYLVDGIPAMTPPGLHQYLVHLGLCWQHQGLALEVGCWLGATSRSLLSGLKQAGYNLPFHAYDRWTASPEEVSKAAARGLHLELHQDLCKPYLDNVTKVYGDVVAHRQEIGDDFEPGELGSPIEICLLDAPKKDPVFSRVMDVVVARSIPGVTIFGLLDYRLHELRPNHLEYLAPLKYIEKHATHFSRLATQPMGSTAAFFRYEG
jgi:hypothetical protein